MGVEEVGWGQMAWRLSIRRSVPSNVYQARRLGNYMFRCRFAVRIQTATKLLCHCIMRIMTKYGLRRYKSGSLVTCVSVVGCTPTCTTSCVELVVRVSTSIWFWFSLSGQTVRGRTDETQQSRVRLSELSLSPSICKRDVSEGLLTHTTRTAVPATAV